MSFMQERIDLFKNYLCDRLNIPEDIPGLRDQINRKFVDIAFNDSPRNIISGISASSLMYISLFLIYFDWKLHVWLSLNYLFYFMRYALYAFYNKGSFLGFSAVVPRLSDFSVTVSGIISGLFSSSLVLLTTSSGYPPNSMYVSMGAIFLYYSAALSLNANIPIWYTPFAITTIIPIFIFIVLKGNLFIMGGIVILYSSTFIYLTSLRNYRLNYESYLLRYENINYVKELHESKQDIIKFVDNLQKNNKKLSLEVVRRKEAEKSIRKLATIDLLTGVTNRVSLEEKMKRAIRNAERTNKMVGIFFIDLDRFKFINDTFGHAAGDELLKGVANRLLQNLRSTDDISRIGGDEFVLLVTNVSKLEDLLIVAQNILVILGKPYDIQGKILVSDASIGISVYPKNGNTPADLMRDADIAMYHAKEISGSSFFFFTKEMNEVMIRRLKIEKWLQSALEEDGFHFFFQPIVCMKTGKITSAELLIRFVKHNYQDTGYVGPDEFISIAEKNGLINKIGNWGIEEACRILQRLHHLGHDNLRIALNISIKHLVDPNFLSHFKMVIQESKINPAQLEIEITETQAIENRSFVESIIKEIVRLGVKLSIDDFGTGHSNFCYLRELPVSKIKIDRSFLMEWDTNKNSQPLVKAIISVAKALNLEVVAEGVETPEQLEFLKTNKCHYAQGYYFSKAIPEADFLALLDQERSGQSFSSKFDPNSLQGDELLALPFSHGDKEVSI